MSQTSKKLVLVSAISVPVTDGGEKIVIIVSCIYYPVWFQRDQEQVRALLNSGSEINVISPAYAKKLGLMT